MLLSAHNLTLCAELDGTLSLQSPLPVSTRHRLSSRHCATPQQRSHRCAHRPRPALASLPQPALRRPLSNGLRPRTLPDADGCSPCATDWPDPLQPWRYWCSDGVIHADRHQATTTTAGEPISFVSVVTFVPFATSVSFVCLRPHACQSPVLCCCLNCCSRLLSRRQSPRWTSPTCLEL